MIIRRVGDALVVVPARADLDHGVGGSRAEDYRRDLGFRGGRCYKERLCIARVGDEAEVAGVGVEGGDEGGGGRW